MQAEIIDLLVDLQEDFGTAIILITHDLGIVAGTCEDTLVMFGGKVMEHRKTADLFANPEHPYTQGLMAAIPRLDKKVDVLCDNPKHPPETLPPKAFKRFSELLPKRELCIIGRIVARFNVEQTTSSSATI